jgi:hypothetical protein
MTVNTQIRPQEDSLISLLKRDNKRQPEIISPSSSQPLVIDYNQHSQKSQGIKKKEQEISFKDKERERKEREKEKEKEFLHQQGKEKYSDTQLSLTDLF